MAWQGYLQEAEDLYQTHSAPAFFTAGHPIGVIAIDLVYPKLPGNVVNASTYDFPVLYKKVSFEIEALFAGDPAICQQIVEAAVYLEENGVRAIIGACGYFAHFQQEVAAAVSVPVFMSSLCQEPLIKLALKPEQKILVFAADGKSATAEFFAKVKANLEDCIIQDVGGLASFAPIRWGKTTLDNKKLTEDLAALARDAVERHPEIGAILLECSDLPPYAGEIQRATGLPIFDFITLIKWVKSAVVQQRYYGIF